MLNSQLQRQKPANSPAVKQKIEKLYSDERELLTKYIDAELQAKLLAELANARANPAPASDAETPDVLNSEKAKAEKKGKLPTAVQAKGGASADGK
jgi:hypothetical protein